MNKTSFWVSIIPILSTLILVTFTFIFNTIISKLNQRREISSKIIEQFFKAREEIVNEISLFASIKSISDINFEAIQKYSNALNNLYYKYYDFLPSPVKDSILCLRVTIIDKKNRLFKMENNILQVIKEEEIEKHIKNSFPIANSEFFTYGMIHTKEHNQRRIACINLQSKYVLNTMNKFFTMENLLKWIRNMEKEKKS